MREFEAVLVHQLGACPRDGEIIGLEEVGDWTVYDGPQHCYTEHSLSKTGMDLNRWMVMTFVQDKEIRQRALRIIDVVPRELRKLARERDQPFDREACDRIVNELWRGILPTMKEIVTRAIDGNAARAKRDLLRLIPEGLWKP